MPLNGKLKRVCIIIKILNLLMYPHLSERQLETNMFSLACALDTLDEGAVLVNSQVGITWYNRSFALIVEECVSGHILVTDIIGVVSNYYNNIGACRDELSMFKHAFMLKSNVDDFDKAQYELYCRLLPTDMIGAENYALCILKVKIPQWSRIGQHLRRTFFLTHREIQITIECLRGKRDVEIAEHLKIRPLTVNEHLDNVYRKMKIRGRAQLAAYLLDTLMPVHLD